MNTNSEIRTANEVEELNELEIECVNGGAFWFIPAAMAVAVVGRGIQAGLVAHQAGKNSRRGGR